MKRTISRVAAAMLILSPYLLQAKTVNEVTARSIGCNYLMQHGVQAVHSPADLELSYTATSQIGGKTVADFYVFNIKGSEGFVMVTADDVVMPVLAYSSEASFYFEKIAPAAVDWIDNYRKQIEYVISNNLGVQPGVEARWQALKTAQSSAAAKTTSVAPMLTTLWDQSTYYNASCPGSGSSKAVTGCVATAMAQLMKFHNWPVMGTGMHSYLPASYPTQTANFGATAYQWASMPNSVSSTNTAVATLMHHCGVSVDMNYNTAAGGGSGATTNFAMGWGTNTAEYALKAYFHYKPTIKTIYREGISQYVPAFTSYSTSAWLTALKAELTAGRPFIYRGSGSGGGHAWVCDGFESSDNTMHFNWGWSGSGPNGYYSVDDIAPPILGTGGGSGGFNSGQAAIINVQPDTYPTITDNIKLKQPIKFTTSVPVEFNGEITFKTKFVNTRSTAFSGSFCAQIFDTANNYVTTIDATTGAVSVPAGDSTVDIFFYGGGIKRLVAGGYIVKLMYRNTGASSWSPVGNNGNLYNYSYFDVKNDVDMRVYSPINITTGQPIALGGSVTINTRIFNYSSMPFDGNMRVQLINVTTGTAYPLASESGASFPEYYWLSKTFTGTNTAPSGWYALEIQHQYDGVGSYYTTGSKDHPNPILVAVGTVDVKEMENLKHQVIIYPNPAADRVTIMFNDNKVSEVIISDLSGKIVDRMVTDPNASSMQLSVSGYAAGTYVAQFVAGQEIITQKLTITK